MLSEIRNIIKYWKLAPKQKELLFYSEHAGYYSYYEGLINELVKSEIPSVYITSQADDPVLETSSDLFVPLYINKLRTFFLLFIKCKIVIMTMTDLNTYELKRSINPVHYIYMFHSLVSTHMMYTKTAFEHFDAVFCTGDYQIEELKAAEAQNNWTPKTLVKAGYYRLERIYNSYKKISSKQKNEKKTVLVAPSWGDENIIKTCGVELIGKLLEDYKVILRPHPETGRRDPELLDKINSQYSANSDFTLELSVSTDDSLLNSDLLICDCSGVVLEYSLGTERPVLFIDVPLKIKNSEYASLNLPVFEVDLREKIGKIISVDSISNVNTHVSELIDSESYAKEIANIRDREIYNFGSSSKAEIEYIKTILAK
jgi:CDP-glycerol glycerophosphotransferase (TagB/SpsB family)